MSEPGKITLEGLALRIVGSDIPPEPPVKTVIVDADGLLHQRLVWIRWHGVFYSPKAEWTAVGERRGQSRPTWVEILQRGPVTILWTPPEPKPEEEP